jgi:hypothetical protein
MEVEEEEEVEVEVVVGCAVELVLESGCSMMSGCSRPVLVHDVIKVVTEFMVGMWA